MRKVNFYTTDGVKEIEGKCTRKYGKMWIFKSADGEEYFRVLDRYKDEYLIKQIDFFTCVGMSPEDYADYQEQIADFEEQQERMTYQRYKDMRGE